MDNINLEVGAVYLIADNQNVSTQSYIHEVNINLEVGAVYLIADNQNVSTQSYIHEVVIAAESKDCYKTIWNNGDPRWMYKSDLRSTEYKIIEKLK